MVGVTIRHLLAHDHVHLSKKKKRTNYMQTEVIEIFTTPSVVLICHNPPAFLVSNLYVWFVSLHGLVSTLVENFWFFCTNEVYEGTTW